MRSGRLARRPLTGFFRVFVALVFILSASWADAALSRCAWMPAAIPLRRMRHMGGAPIIVRAMARPAGSGVATTGRVADPPISATLASFIEVRRGASLPGPPPLTRRVRNFLVGISIMPGSVMVALRIAARLHARRGGAISCFTSPARASSQTGVRVTRQVRRRDEKEPKEELSAYVFLPMMVMSMPIVEYDLVLVANGIPGAAQEKTYKYKMVVVVGLFVASGFALTSTVLRSGRYSSGSAVADFFLATGSAPTPFPWLLPRRALARSTTDR